MTTQAMWRIIPQVPTTEIKGSRGHYQGAQGEAITVTNSYHLGWSFMFSYVIPFSPPTKHIMACFPLLPLS